MDAFLPYMTNPPRDSLKAQDWFAITGLLCILYILPCLVVVQVSINFICLLSASPHAYIPMRFYSLKPNFSSHLFDCSHPRCRAY